MKVIGVYSTIIGAALIWPGASTSFMNSMGAVLPAGVMPNRVEGASSPADRYLTSAVEGIALPKTVSATGALNASIVVEVGSQLSGQITNVAADFNDDVKMGQVLAQLDQSTLKEQVASAQAALDGARADAGIMSDHDDRATLTVNAVKHFKHAPARDAVESAGGLIREQQSGLANDRTGDRHALLLATGELRRQPISLRG